jgi:hypothetical protein
MVGLNAQAKAWAYLRNKGKSKVKNNSRFPSGMTNKKGKYGDSALRLRSGQNDDGKDRSRFPMGMTSKKDNDGDSALRLRSGQNDGC